MALAIPTMHSFFISGGFAETLDDMRVIQDTLKGMGFSATIKQNDSGPTSAELIEH